LLTLAVLTIVVLLVRSANLSFFFSLAGTDL